MIGYGLTLSRIKSREWCSNCVFWSWTYTEQRSCKITEAYQKCIKLLYGDSNRRGKNKRPLYAMFHKNNFAYVVEENKNNTG